MTRQEQDREKLDTAAWAVKLLLYGESTFEDDADLLRQFQAAYEIAKRQREGFKEYDQARDRGVVREERLPDPA